MPWGSGCNRACLFSFSLQLASLCLEFLSIFCFLLASYLMVRLTILSHFSLDTDWFPFPVHIISPLSPPVSKAPFRLWCSPTHTPLPPPPPARSEQLRWSPSLSVIVQLEVWAAQSLQCGAVSLDGPLLPSLTPYLIGAQPGSQAFLFWTWTSHSFMSNCGLSSLWHRTPCCSALGTFLDSDPEIHCICQPSRCWDLQIWWHVFHLCIKSLIKAPKRAQAEACTRPCTRSTLTVMELDTGSPLLAKAPAPWGGSCISQFCTPSTKQRAENQQAFYK